MAKLNKWIRAKKAKASCTKNLGQLETFLIADTSKTVTELRQVFVEAPILNYVDPKCYICIETDISSYIISRIFSQLILDDLSQCHYGELLAIVKPFKTWRHYLKGCKYEVFVLTDHHNL